MNCAGLMTIGNIEVGGHFRAVLALASQVVGEHGNRQGKEAEHDADNDGPGLCVHCVVHDVSIPLAGSCSSRGSRRSRGDVSVMWSRGGDTQAPAEGG